MIQFEQNNAPYTDIVYDHFFLFKIIQIIILDNLVAFIDFKS